MNKILKDFNLDNMMEEPFTYEDKVSHISYEFYTGNDWVILEKYNFTHILWFNK